MSALTRTRVGAYRLEDAHTLDDIINAGREGAENMMLGLESMFMEYPAAVADAENERRCRNGLAPRLSEAPLGLFRLRSESGEFLALCRSGDGVSIVKSFYEV